MATKAFKRYEKEVEELLGKASPIEDDSDEEEEVKKKQSDKSEDYAGGNEEEDLAEWVQRAQRSHDKNQKKFADEDNENEREYPFAPRISMKSRELWGKIPQEPIHLRYEKELSKREKKVQLLKEELEKEQKLKEEALLPIKDGKIQSDNVPLTKFDKLEKKIKSERLSKKARTPSIYERKNIYESGMSWLKNKDSKLAEQQTERLEQELANLNFQPTINRNNAYYSSISKSFERRQKQFDEEKKLRQSRLEIEETKKFHHSPHINHKSKQLAHKKKMETEIARKAEILDKMIEDEEIRIFEEDNLWRSAPSKHPKDLWDSNTVSDFNMSNGNSLPIKPGTMQKKKGIHDLKTYEPRIANKIIPKIPEDDFIQSPSNYNYQMKSPPKDISRPLAPRKSIGLVSPAKAQSQPNPPSPKASNKKETLPKQSIKESANSRSPVRNDDLIRKSSKPTTPQRVTYAKKQT